MNSTLETILARLCRGLPAIAIFLASVSANAAVWDGSSSGLWSVAANWQGGTLPTSGSSVRFPTGVTRRVTTNDINGFNLNSIVFEDSDYIIRGQAISFQSGSNPTPGVQSSQTSGPSTVACPIVFDAFVPEGSFFVLNTAASLNIEGAVTLNGNLLRV